MNPSNPAARFRFDTRVIHAGEPEPRIGGAASVPIFQSTVYEYRGRAGEELRYSRYNNGPNHEVLARKLADLEDAEAAVVTSSGMAAITTALLTHLPAGSHVLVQDAVYGGTYGFLGDGLRAAGVTHDFIDADDPSGWARAVKPNTKVIYTEGLTNPTLRLIDHRAVVAFARDRGLVSMIDNTFLSPVNFRPAALGYDVILHSATKYLNGHSDLVAGAVIGKAAVVAPIKKRLEQLGGSLDPHACFLLYRGMKTLGLRVRHQNDAARTVATFLSGHAKVRSVHYPGLETNRFAALARSLFTGCGGVLAFEVAGGADGAERFLDRLRVPVVGPSLGGIETLITRPVMTSHRSVAPAERARMGISDELVRLSIGVEDPADLVADLDSALAAV